MSEDRTEEDTAFDADQLAALARPSLPPTQNRDDDDDDDDGPLDLKALTASMAPSAPSDEEQDDEDDDDEDSRVSMASGGASTSADSSKDAGTKSAKGKSSKGKKTKGKSKGKSAAGKSSGKGKSAKSKSSGKSTEPKEEEKKAVAAVAVAPVAEPQSGGSGKMLIGLIALLGIGGVVFALTQNPEPEAQAALYPAATTSVQDEPEAAEDTTPDETPEPENTDEVLAAATPDEVPAGEAAVEVETPEATPEAETDEPRARRRGTSMATTAAATTETSEASAMTEETVEAAVEPSMEAETVAEPTMEQSTSMDDMDDLLTRALGGTPTAGGTMTDAPMVAPMEDRSALPETPSRPAVTRALGGLMARMRQCAGDQVGMATARIRVNNNGQVISANIGGSPFGGTPQGACMERVVQTARFPRFQRTHFDVTYPFSIRAIR